MKILILIHKNTSTLDFLIPSFPALHESATPMEVTLLYCCLNKKAILRDTNYFSKVCAENRVQEVDYTDLSGHPLLKLLSPLFRFSPSDAPSFSEAKRSKSLKGLMAMAWAKIIRKLELTLSHQFFNFENYLRTMKPDHILYENRSTPQFALVEQVHRFFENEKPSVVFLPHAPHYIEETEGYAPLSFGPHGLPAYCHYWLPFLPSKPWLKYPEQKSQAIYVGYPGFDSNWIQECKKNPPLSSKPQILFIGRKFFDKGVQRWNSKDYVTLEYADVLSTLKLVRESTEPIHPDFHLIFKAHPSSRRQLIEQVLTEAGFSSFEVTYEPFYSILNGVQLVVSNYSTSVLIPVFMNIPVVLIDSPLQQFINTHWDVVARMYNEFEFFSRNETETRGNIQRILRERLDASKDLRKLREYFPEGASDRIISDLI